MYKMLTTEQRNKLKNLIIDRVMMNPDVLFNTNNMSDDEIPDIIDIIVGMYEYIHQLSTGGQYDYMWHYANKIGGWCNTNYLYRWLTESEE